MAEKTGNNVGATLSTTVGPVVTQFPAGWDIRRVMGNDSSKYRAEKPTSDNRNLRRWALVYGLLGVLACIIILALADRNQSSRFLVYLACANVAAFGLRLTSSQGVLPAGFLFMLLGIGDLSLAELLFIAVSVTLLREARALRSTRDIRGLLYAIASITIGLGAAQLTYKLILLLTNNALFPAPIIASAFVLMLNGGLSVMLLTRPKEPVMETYRAECRPLLPWFIATAYFAYLVQGAGEWTGYHPAIIALPLLFTLDRGYRTWTASQAERKEEFAQLHRNTLDTLALAIDARDQTTHMHLRRVQISALAVGRELNLSEPELDALNISAMLHDIGKLGIPDHILLKPGSLTEPEWDKMKTHALIGAEMLERMHFPSLVSDIVRTHHEKWDGSGYPLGLKQTEIPIGARILSAVDCLDALASDRPYRAAMPLDEAMDMVRRQSGKSYDPAIIAILEQKYVELDRRARGAVGAASPAADGVSTATPVEGINNLATRVQAEAAAEPRIDILGPIVSARQESQLLRILASDLAQCTHLDEVSTAIYKCLERTIGFDTMGLFVRRGEHLEPTYFLGSHVSLFKRKPFPITEGLSGWVAQHVRPIVNGNMSIESCYISDYLALNNLQSALAVPFEGKGGTAGVITLYHVNRNAFSQDDLRILEAASTQIGPAIETALRFQDVKESATTDHLTGIPNARALALHLNQELERARRNQSQVGVLVCDLDGFKQVNDRFGHLRGNEVLQTVAKGLRETCRGSDYVARMGGDEFVIVVPDFPADYAPQLERLRAAAVAAGKIVSDEPCLSMSVGVAVFPADGLELEALLAKADSKMYQSKRESKSEGGRENDLHKLALAQANE